MENRLTWHAKFLCCGFSLISTYVYSQTEIVCDITSPYLIKQLDKNLSFVKTKRDEYLDKLSERDFIYQITDTRGKEYSQLYNACVKPALEKITFEKTDDGLVNELFRITHEIVSYSSLPQHAEALLSVFDTKVEHNTNEIPSHWITAVDQAFVRTRLFGQAKKFRKRFPQHIFEQIPEYRDKSKKNASRSLMSLQNGGRQLTRHAFKFPEKGHIIVISHPLCHFSQNAILSISSDPVLNSTFKDYSNWVIPTTDTLNVESVLKANAESSIKYDYVYRETEWPEIDYWGTPAFYFYREGKLLRKIVGWPKEGRREEILEALQLIGLTASSD